MVRLLRRGTRAFREWFAEQRAEYSGDASRPIAGYSAGLAVYLAGASGVAGMARATGRPSPRLGAGELALMALATHKISRSLAKDPITSPLRMPFTRFEGASAPSELHEEVRASGMEHSLGELVSCPFCLAPWVASGMFTGHVFVPGLTRAVSTIYATVACADFLQYAYAAMQQRSTPPEKR
ncbi:uncharacterized protein DUF1360 [Halopolyspora algeriensis]|uniref:Uncharacterized protein DUF1360 n=1 Tax=Halopolyspora algeriensis TaxID=1500506 RepID=A0A368W0A2_9ACTN|nr:DUF1360 domain-containing protein [Halopolyspora algeriensis]RCW47062.1 uncharacterized protein DUF1360 [Halopolyspora algeriensis]TQM48149.1 uncharacterized protein DUF1360 [Halopolyspora algeriensis]